MTPDERGTPPTDARLHALFDQAANGFEPGFEPGRLSGLLGRRRAGRSVFMVPLAAAAALLLLVGTVGALSGNEASPRIAPADAPTPTPTPKPETGAPTVPPKPGPTTSTTAPTSVAPPKEPEATAPPTATPPQPSQKAPNLMPLPTEPKDTTPHATEPKDTAPKDTTPKDTTPKDTSAPPPKDTTPAPPKDTTPPPPKDTTPPPPKDTTPKETVPPVAFSAQQKWGSSAANPPFDEFSGTATPGEKIHVLWQSGPSSYTYTNDQGTWYVKVHFPELTVGQTVEVKVKTASGETRFFSFTRTG